jgi:hypothetical protein
VFENRVLRKTVGPKGQKATGDCRMLHNVALLDLYPSPNIIRIFKSRKMVWVRHVVRIEEKKNTARV